MANSKFKWLGKSEDGKTVTLKQLDTAMFKFAPPPIADVFPDLVKFGAVVDVETSGLSFERDKIIELGIRKFSFNRATGEILSLGESYSSFQDPGFPLSEEVTGLTGITDEMVKGQQIDWAAANKILSEAQIIVAHNAGFDRPFIDSHSEVSQQKIWGCSFKQIDWSSKGFPSQKLEILGIYHGFFTGSHRALNDSDALLYILNQQDTTLGKPYFAELISNARRVTVEMVASNSPFESKDHLRLRNYRWDAQNKYWHKSIFKDDLAAELEWLELTVYNGKFRGRFEEIPINENFK